MRDGLSFIQARPEGISSLDDEWLRAVQPQVYQVGSHPVLGRADLYFGRPVQICFIFNVYVYDGF